MTPVKSNKPKAGKRPAKPGYGVVAVSLYTDQKMWVDRVAQEVGSTGHKQNRSFVVQVAIEALAQQLLDRGSTSPDAIAEFFRNFRRKRSALGTRHRHLWLY